MVFLGEDHYKNNSIIYSLVEQLSEGRKYHNMIYISDKVKEVVEFIENNPPIKTNNGL